MDHWVDKKIIVTGGASFIGSHLVEKLVQLGSKITVIDDLSSGKKENISSVWDKINFKHNDLEYIQKNELVRLFKDQELVFHLAAVHGGRGYITNHPADVTSNLAIDHHVFDACVDSKVEKIVFSSSACVYPKYLQNKDHLDYIIKEDDSNPQKIDDDLSADVEYGWSKLMSEISLLAFQKQYGLKAVSLRFATAFGPRASLNHAIIALIYKALQKMDPYDIWGDGNQERDFTYVDDIVSGLMLASEKISDGDQINLGTGKKYKIIQVVNKIFNLTNWKPAKINFDLSKPVGVYSRALDITKAKEKLGWEPKYALGEGLRKTIEWCKINVKPKLDPEKLMER